MILHVSYSICRIKRHMGHREGGILFKRGAKSREEDSLMRDLLSN